MNTTKTRQTETTKPRRSTRKVETVETVEAIEPTAEDRAARLVAAKAEYAAWKAWNNAGRVGTEPSTKNLDAIRTEEPTTSKERKMKKSLTPKVAVRYYRDGEPKADRYNTFGRLGRRDGYTTKSMTEYLAGIGITEPTSTTWFTTLPSGIVIGAVVEGETPPAGILVKSTKLDRTIGRAVKSIEKGTAKAAPKSTTKPAPKSTAKVTPIAAGAAAKLSKATAASKASAASTAKVSKALGAALLTPKAPARKSTSKAVK